MKAHQCQHCGIFSKYTELDSYTPYGCANYDDPEPYDPVMICKRCSDDLYEKFIDSFKRGYYRTGDWCKSNAEIRAAKDSGLIWIGNDSDIQYNGKRAFNEYVPIEVFNEQSLTKMK